MMYRGVILFWLGLAASALANGDDLLKEMANGCKEPFETVQLFNYESCNALKKMCEGPNTDWSKCGGMTGQDAANADQRCMAQIDKENRKISTYNSWVTDCKNRKAAEETKQKKIYDDAMSKAKTDPALTAPDANQSTSLVSPGKPKTDWAARANAAKKRMSNSNAKRMRETTRLDQTEENMRIEQEQAAQRKKNRIESKVSMITTQ